MAFIRVYVKKQLQIGRLNFDQRQMYKIGTVGVATVKNRLAKALGPGDTRAKPLTKSYARHKSRMISKGGFARTGPGSGRKGVRNLKYTGKMLANLMVRTVSERRARANLTTRKDRMKGWANQKIEPWIVFSPKNQVAVMEAAGRIWQENIKRRIFTTALGRQR